MGRIILRNHPSKILPFELLEVITDPIKIKIHMVRIYNDGKTILSVINLKIKDKDYYYTSIVREGFGTSPARTGDYYGYLLVWGDNNTSRWKVDNIKNKQRILTMFEKLEKFDTRLPGGPDGFQKGGTTSTSHVGLRIYQKSIKRRKKADGSIIEEGGSRMFHVGYHYHHTIGCEILGETAKFYKGIETVKNKTPKIIEDLYMIEESGKGNLSFINNIVKVYEDNVASREQSAVEIDIRVDFNIINNLSKTAEIIPKDIYNQLYPKVKPLNLKTKGLADLKPQGIENTNLKF